MAILILCPSCGNKLRAPETLIGRQARCSQCSTVFTVSASANQQAAPEKESAPSRTPTTPRETQTRTVSCPACGPVGVPEEWLGRWINCPHCRMGFVASTCADQEIRPATYGSDFLASDRPYGPWRPDSSPSLLLVLFILGHLMNIVLMFVPAVRVLGFMTLTNYDLIEALFQHGKVALGLFMLLLFVEDLAAIVLALVYPKRWIFITSSVVSAFGLLTTLFHLSARAGDSPERFMVQILWIPMILAYIAGIFTLSGFFIKPRSQDVSADGDASALLPLFQSAFTHSSPNTVPTSAPMEQQPSLGDWAGPPRQEQIQPDPRPVPGMTADTAASVSVGDCPGCHTPLTVPTKLVGHWIECPKCGMGFGASVGEEQRQPATSAMDDGRDAAQDTDDSYSSGKSIQDWYLPATIVLGLAGLVLIGVTIKLFVSKTGAGFDPFDLEKTIAWAEQEYQILRQIKSQKNEILYEKTCKEAEARYKQLVGQQVRWRMTVESVKNNKVLLTTEWTVNEPEYSMPLSQLVIHLWPGEEPWKETEVIRPGHVTVDYLQFDRQIPGKRAETLKKGGSVPIRGHVKIAKLGAGPIITISHVRAE